MKPAKARMSKMQSISKKHLNPNWTSLHYALVHIGAQNVLQHTNSSLIKQIGYYSVMVPGRTFVSSTTDGAVLILFISMNPPGYCSMMQPFASIINYSSLLILTQDKFKWLQYSENMLFLLSMQSTFWEPKWQNLSDCFIIPPTRLYFRELLSAKLAKTITLFEY